MRASFKFIFCFIIFITRYNFASAQSADKPNIILIVVDDLNDYVEGITDLPQVYTPNIKSLEESGTLFTNAFTNSPGCAPSRTSFLSGKDLLYTQVYNNEDYESNFRTNFTSEKNNAEVYTLPEMLKDSGGYFTYAINKIFHNADKNDFDNHPDIPACEKKLSWNRLDYIDEPDSVTSLLETYRYGDFFSWGMIPDSLEPMLEDYIAADSAVSFLNQFAVGNSPTCGKPFFLALGIGKPHSDRFIPAKYYSGYFLNNIYAEPYKIPYNHPISSYPFNGFVMPAQPAMQWADYYALPENGIGQAMADVSQDYELMFDYYESLSEIPEIDPTLTDSDRAYIIEESMRANYVMNYMAAAQFADAQIGKILKSLNQLPELKKNTVIIVVSDNGYATGEKRHWTKWGLWETDIRVPFIVAGPDIPGGKINQNTVSLLDLFPTVCEFANVTAPLFSNGEKYLDGMSLVPLIENPTLNLTRPVLTSHKKNSSIGSCFPANSVRDKRFHYIRYRQNNDGAAGINDCDSTTEFFEEELYEIGEHRETDPNEWYNLINNPDYATVINYLQQFLPDSNLYLKATFQAVINNNILDCLVSHSDTLKLSFDWLNKNGAADIPSPVNNYKWTNNLTNDIFWGTTAEFPLSLISDAVFNLGKTLMFYLQVFDSSGDLIAFDTKYFYLNPATEPNGSFGLLSDSPLTASITDFSITGSYNCFWWEINGDSLFYNQVPGPITFTGPGEHPINLFIQYGNTPCINSIHQTVITDIRNQELNHEISIYPNPASELVHVIFNTSPYPGRLELIDLNGKMIKSIEIGANAFPEIDVNISELASGLYLMHFINAHQNTGVPFIIQCK